MNYNKRYAWKVTRKHFYSKTIGLNNTFFSFETSCFAKSKIVSNSDEAKRCFYTKDKWTVKPKDGNPLFVFLTRKDARFFIKIHNHKKTLRIHKAEIKNPQRVEAYFNRISFPKGTILADEVKLID